MKMQNEHRTSKHLIFCLQDKPKFESYQRNAYLKFFIISNKRIEDVLQEEISMVITCNSIFTAKRGTPVDAVAASTDVAPFIR
jgi:hypothetical protein